MSERLALGTRLLRLPPVLLIGLVWGVLAALNIAIASLSSAYSARTPEILTSSLSGLLLSLLLYAITRRLVNAASRFALPLIAVLAILCGSSLWIINVLLQFWVGGHGTAGHEGLLSWPGDYFIRLRYNWMYFVTLFALQAVIFALINFSRTLATRERQLLEARLASLRFQLNPHFLFNTLNAIATLVAEGSVTTAEEMITRLSDFLRTSLSEEPTALVSLSRELDTIQAYLDIESVRFGNRLVIKYACDAGLADVQVPSLILQPLVENAIKYAVAPSKEPVTLSIEASVFGNKLTLVVKDDARHKFVAHSAPSTGVGLRNVAARLEALYGPKAGVEAVRRERGFTAVIRLPLHETNGRLANR